MAALHSGQDNIEANQEAQNELLASTDNLSQEMVLSLRALEVRDVTDTVTQNVESSAASGTYLTMAADNNVKLAEQNIEQILQEPFAAANVQMFGETKTREGLKIYQRKYGLSKKSSTELAEIIMALEDKEYSDNASGMK